MKSKALAAGTCLCFLGLVLCGCVSTQRYNDLLSEKEALSLDKIKLATQNEDLRAKVAGLARERDTLADQVVLLKDQLEEAQGKATTAVVKIASLQNEIQEKQNQVNALNTQIEKLNAEIERLKTDNEELKSKLAPAPETGAEPAPTPETE